MEASRYDEEIRLAAQVRRWKELAETYETALQEVETVILARLKVEEGIAEVYPGTEADARVRELRWSRDVIEAALNDGPPPCKTCWPNEERRIVTDYTSDCQAIVAPCSECQETGVRR